MILRILQLLRYLINGKKKQTVVRYKIGNIKYHNSSVDTLIPQLVEIGDNFISAPGSIILAHDASLYLRFGVYRCQKTTIGNNVFLGANSVVLPGVTIGDGAIIGAGAIVTRDVEANSVVAGNPAVKISTVDEYYKRCLAKGCLVEAPDGFKQIKNNKRLTAADIDEFQTKVIDLVLPKSSF